jgi:hypothetical protein
MGFGGPLVLLLPFSDVFHKRFVKLTKVVKGIPIDNPARSKLAILEDFIATMVRFTSSGTLHIQTPKLFNHCVSFGASPCWPTTALIIQVT